MAGMGGGISVGRSPYGGGSLGGLQRTSMSAGATAGYYQTGGQKPAGSFGGTSNGSLYGQDPWPMETSQAVASGMVKRRGDQMEYNGGLYSWDQAKHGWTLSGTAGGGGPQPPSGGSGGPGGGADGPGNVPVPSIATGGGGGGVGVAGARDGGGYGVGGGQAVGLRNPIGMRNPPSLQALLRAGSY